MSQAYCESTTMIKTTKNRFRHEMYKKSVSTDNRTFCGAIFDRKYKHFDFVLFSVEVKIHDTCKNTILV